MNKSNVPAGYLSSGAKNKSARNVKRAPENQMLFQP